MNKKMEIEELIQFELQKKEEVQAFPQKEQPREIIRDLHNAAILNQVKTDEETNKKFIDQAKKTVDNELASLNQENIAKRQGATYNANAEACRCYGIEAAVPLWQIYLMRVGHSIWFVIYWIVATLTICPINVFVTGINAFIKKTWLSIIISVLLYLFFTIAVPLITLELRKGGAWK